MVANWRSWSEEIGREVMVIPKNIFSRNTNSSPAGVVWGGGWGCSQFQSHFPGRQYGLGDCIFSLSYFIFNKSMCPEIVNIQASRMQRN